MNIEKFKRNISLLKLGIADLEGNEKIIYEFLISNLSELNTYLSEENPEYLYFGKDINKIVLYYDKISGYLYLHYHYVSSFLLNDFGMDIHDSEKLIRWWVGNTLELNPTYIQFFAFSSKLTKQLHIV